MTRANVRAPEILAPGGDRAAIEAAVHAGADAVYFGLPGSNARARAANVTVAELSEVMSLLHRHGRKGYVTLNTLVFDDELPALETQVRACAAAGVDAVIVQDLGVLTLVRAIAPTLPVHASTQMTCTDAGSAEFARELGAARVILARELSLDDIASLRRGTEVELEVFVHGALCIAYSGQCLTSEAIGGRSANRGACAQACRLPYDLVVDGTVRDLADRVFLLSPEDLEASELVPRLVELGIASLKIEGRLKGPEYVAATTSLYRQAVAAAVEGQAAPTTDERELALAMFSRGSGPGFLAGVDHQRLVEARSSDHRGLALGTVVAVERAARRTWLTLDLSRPLARGDGLLIAGHRGIEGELGGRVWAIEQDGQDVTAAVAGEARVWFGPDLVVGDAPLTGRRVFLTGSPEQERRARALGEKRGTRKERVDVVLRGAAGEPLVVEARTERGRAVRMATDVLLAPATGRGLDAALVSEKLGGFGEAPWAIGSVDVAFGADLFVPPSALKRVRRELEAALAAASDQVHETREATVSSLVGAATAAPLGAPPPAGLFVLCRTEAQAKAALDAGAAGVYLDFLELTGTGKAFRSLRADAPPGAKIGVAPPRIRKPGEEKIDQYLASLGPDMVLVRGLGALRELGGGRAAGAPLAVADFSLNASNTLTARLLLDRGAAAFVPSYDLDAAQLVRWLAGPLAPFAEVVVHHPMPLFHMEHCVIAALLSEGRDHKTCGRPCERHRVALRDRAGMEHPVEADVGCRNTVFHARSQCGADVVPALVSAGVRRFRLELVRESAEQVAGLVASYAKLIAGEVDATEVWRDLRRDPAYGVVRGSLRVLA